MISCSDINLSHGFEISIQYDFGFMEKIFITKLHRFEVIDCQLE
jgi:hypothetical protein